MTIFLVPASLIPVEQRFMDLARLCKTSSHLANSPGSYHGRSDSTGAISLGAARRPALGGALLCANRRIDRSHDCNVVYCSSLLLDLCARLEDYSLGGTGTNGGKGSYGSTNT